MGVKLIYLQIAIDDLQSIYEYIGQNSKKYARLEVKKIKEFIESLKNFPLKGKYYDTIKDKEIRSIVFRNYIIFYIVSHSHISILSIHHHARSISSNVAFTDSDE
jgi:toxin ParE1/3/4